MNLREDIKSITDLKLRPASLIGEVRKNRRPVVITQNGVARVVVQDIASYEATRKALLLLKMTAQGEADIRQGKMAKQRDVFARMDQKLHPHA